MDLLSKFPALLNASYEVLNSKQASYVSSASDLFEGPEVLKGFDPTAEFWRGVPLVTLANYETWDPGQPAPDTKTYQNYELLMKRRAKRASKTIPKAVIDAGAKRLFNWVQETLDSWMREKPRIVDKFAFNFYNLGTVSAGSNFFDNTVLVQDGPTINDLYPTKVYDNKPWFATDHPRSKLDANTIGNFEAATYGFSRDYLETKYVTYSITNAVDEFGNEIVQYPDILLCNDALRFTIEPVLNSQFRDADLQESASRNLLKPVYSRYLTGTPTTPTTAQWILTQRKNTGACIVTQWGADEISYWYDEDLHVNKMDHVFYYGGVVYEIRRSYMCNQSAT